MKRKKNFNWDQLCKNTSYANVKIKHTGLIPMIPTMYSPDGSQIYLQSLDFAVGVNNVELLCYAFKSIHENMRSEAANFDWSVKKIAELEQDYLAVWNLLYGLDALPGNYRFPEYHLKKIWNEVRPPKPN